MTSGSPGETRGEPDPVTRDWEQTFDAIRDGILLLDSSGRVERGNRAARELFSPSVGELTGRPLDEILGSIVTAQVEEAVENGGGELGEPTRIPRLEGVFTIAAWPRGEDRTGPPVIIVEDVSEKVRLREQLIHSEKLSALGELISGIAHELNNPLTAVLGYAQILELKGEGKFEEEFKHLREESLRASRIVRNLLTFARRTEPKREPIDLNDIIRRTVALRAYDLRVRNIEVVEILDEALPRSMMDRGQIQQVVLNLLNNAEHAIHSAKESGRIEVSTTTRGERLLFSITDDGPGVPEEDRGQIFNPFFTTKPVGQGTGLGLPICYGLVRDHDGETWLDADHEGGARFVVELPVVTWRPATS